MKKVIRKGVIWLLWFLMIFLNKWWCLLFINKMNCYNIVIEFCIRLKLIGKILIICMWVSFDICCEKRDILNKVVF